MRIAVLPAGVCLGIVAFALMAAGPAAAATPGPAPPAPATPSGNGRHTAIAGSTAGPHGTASFQAQGPTTDSKGWTGRLAFGVPNTAGGTAQLENGQVTIDAGARVGVGTVTLKGTVGRDLGLGFEPAIVNSQPPPLPSPSPAHPAAARQAPGAAATLMASRRAPPPAGAAQPTFWDALGAAAHDVLDFVTALIRSTAVFGFLGLLLLALIPGLRTTAAATAHTAPWSRLGLGLVILLTVPTAAILFFILGLSIGVWWLGPFILGLYPLMLVSVAAITYGLGALALLSRTPGLAPAAEPALPARPPAAVSVTDGRRELEGQRAVAAEPGSQAGSEHPSLAGSPGEAAPPPKPQPRPRRTHPNPG